MKTKCQVNKGNRTLRRRKKKEKTSYIKKKEGKNFRNRVEKF